MDSLDRIRDVLSSLTGVINAFATVQTEMHNGLKEHFAKMRQETIVAAAIQVDGIEVEGYAPHKIVLLSERPGRHHHPSWFISTHAFDIEKNSTQGFLTSTGRFVDRKEACVIARAAGQLIRKTGGDSTLYSEDLW